ncbi:MAG: hypothetical protein ACJAWS_000700 [Oleiphilaceae bacterium]|jgi:hypothetical protein
MIERMNKKANVMVGFTLNISLLWVIFKKENPIETNKKILTFFWCLPRGNINKPKKA